MIIRSLPESVSFGALERLYIAQIRIMSVHTSEVPPLRAFTKFNTPQCPLSEARESMLPYQALTSLCLPATLECGAIDALLHCFVFRNQDSHIDLGRLTLSRRHRGALGCSIRDARPVEICLPGSQQSLERLLPSNISGTYPIGSKERRSCICHSMTKSW